MARTMRGQGPLPSPWPIIPHRLAMWYNSCKTAIIPGLWPGRCAGKARSRPHGRLYHIASRCGI